MLYDANWKNIWLRPGKNGNYILSIPELIQKGVPDPKTGKTPLIAMQLLETEVPSKKSKTPVDITQVVSLGQPHLYFEILKEYDGKNMLFFFDRFQKR